MLGSLIVTGLLIVGVVVYTALAKAKGWSTTPYGGLDSGYAGGSDGGDWSDGGDGGDGGD